MKKYHIIYADPPWAFSSKELYGDKINGYKKRKRFTPLEKHYSIMSMKDIKNLKVEKITDKDCALFLWVTDAHLKQGIEVMNAWGFKYVTVAFVWEKRTVTGKLVANLGAWTMKNYEICLFGTKGKMLQYKKVNNIYQKVIAIREKHSKKPDEIRNRIVKLFGNISRIELFAREKYDGWDYIGNNIDGKDIREVLNYVDIANET